MERPRGAVPVTQSRGPVSAPIDHLVYAVPHLGAGVHDVEDRLGVSLTPGGSHPGLGTRNALLRIGPRVYLEVVGPDPEQTPPRGGLWLARGAAALPALVTWAARCNALREFAAGPGAPLLGPVRSMSRATPGGDRISWTLTMPRDPLPRHGIVPFFIDWGRTPHPCADLPDAGVALTKLHARHHNPEAVRADLGRVGVELEIKSGPPALEAVLRTPGQGAVTL